MRNGPAGWTMRSRDAFLVGVGLLIGGAVVFLLTFPPGGGGGMMSGMGGMMGGMTLGVLFFVLAVAFVMLAVVRNAAKASAAAPAVPPLPWTPPAPAPPAVAPPVVSSEVEAAVVRMLDEDERLLYLRIRDAGGAVLQKEVVGWGTFSAAKVTRLLDLLEAKGLLVRERHGATNRIRLTRQPISGM